MQKEITILQEKLSLLKSLDAFQEYTFLPTVAESYIRGFEVQHSITLPEDYRTFLTNIANGGPGPSCAEGLIPFTEAISTQWLPDPSSIARPFPYRYAVDLAEEYQRERHKLPSIDGDYRDFVKQHSYTIHGSDGCLPISDAGCGDFIVLVVIGAERGNLWTVSWDAAAPLQNGSHTDQRVTFFLWYNAWLDEMITYEQGKDGTGDKD